MGALQGLAKCLETGRCARGRHESSLPARGLMSHASLIKVLIQQGLVLPAWGMRNYTGAEQQSPTNQEMFFFQGG